MCFNFIDMCPVQNIPIFPVHLSILLWQVIIIVKHNAAADKYLGINTEVGSEHFGTLSTN